MAGPLAAFIIVYAWTASWQWYFAVLATVIAIVLALALLAEGRMRFLAADKLLADILALGDVQLPSLERLGARAEQRPTSAGYDPPTSSGDPGLSSRDLRQLTETVQQVGALAERSRTGDADARNALPKALFDLRQLVESAEEPLPATFLLAKAAHANEVEEREQAARAELYERTNRFD